MITPMISIEKSVGCGNNIVSKVLNIENIVQVDVSGFEI